MKDVIRLARYSPEDHDDPDFTDDSPLCGKCVAVYGYQSNHPAYGEVLISEYANGQFWTIVERNDYLGTLSGAIKFLNDNL